MGGGGRDRCLPRQCGREGIECSQRAWVQFARLLAQVTNNTASVCRPPLHPASSAPLPVQRGFCTHARTCTYAHASAHEREREREIDGRG